MRPCRGGRRRCHAPTLDWQLTARMHAVFPSIALRLFFDLSPAVPSLPPTWPPCSNLAGNRLTGSLPGQLFAMHRLLTAADLSGNSFAGALPDAWAASRVGGCDLGSSHGWAPAFE